jgi:acetyl esterase/lipase
MRIQPGLLILLAVAAFLLAGCQSVLFASLNSTTPRSDVELRRGIVFDPAHRLELDVYRPAHADHAPVVVFFYGGSWVRGERDWYRFVGMALAAHGVVAIIPDYRKVPDVNLDGFMADAALAVAWAHAHVEVFGGDAQDLFVMGHSAGGHIAGLLATDPQWLAADRLRPRDLAGFIGLAGVYTFLPDDADDDDMLALFGSDSSEQQRASPLHHVSGAEPPMLLLHGTDDHEVDPDNSRALAAAIQAAHEEVELKLYPAVGHSTLLFSMAQPLRSRAPTLEDVLAFIRAHPRATDDATPGPADSRASNAAAP